MCTGWELEGASCSKGVALRGTSASKHTTTVGRVGVKSRLLVSVTSGLNGESLQATNETVETVETNNSSGVLGLLQNDDHVLSKWSEDRTRHEAIRKGKVRGSNKLTLMGKLTKA
jgi:3-dehydroquinate synthase class II